jgi:hypothetical protein
MKNAIEFIKEHLFKILTVFFFLLYLTSSCSNSRLTTLTKKIDQLKSKIDTVQIKYATLPTQKEVRDQMERVMFDFIIYEDDLDKGKVSVSGIKNRIESND